MSTFDLNAFSNRFREETDRACAVLGAALLDSRLENLYRRRLRCSKDALLSKGPIVTFSARIKIARALAWINDDVNHDLNVIRLVRNDFAHSFDHELAFANPSVATNCRTLRTAQTLIDCHEVAAIKGDRKLGPEVIRAWGSLFASPRAQYEVTVESLAQHLDQIPGESGDYQGPDFLEEIKQLAWSSMDVRSSAHVESGKLE